MTKYGDFDNEKWNMQNDKNNAKIQQRHLRRRQDFGGQANSASGASSNPILMIFWMRPAM